MEGGNPIYMFRRRVRDVEQARIFKNAEETTKFTLKYYESFFQSLSPKEKGLIGAIQASGIQKGDGREDSMLAIDRCLNAVPGLPYDIIVWRGGDMKFKDRPFVSASLLEEIALKYCHGRRRYLHKIIVKKGAKIIPLRAIDKDYGDGEAEVIIDTKRLKNKMCNYVYW